MPQSMHTVAQKDEKWCFGAEARVHELMRGVEGRRFPRAVLPDLAQLRAARAEREWVVTMFADVGVDNVRVAPEAEEVRAAGWGKPR